MPAKRIYVVDDDPGTCQALEAKARSIGFSIRWFPTAEAFLESLQQDACPGCVVTKIGLPGMSGLDLLAALHDTGVCLSTIVIANRTTTPVTVRAIRSARLPCSKHPSVFGNCGIRSSRQSNSSKNDLPTTLTWNRFGNGCRD